LRDGGDIAIEGERRIDLEPSCIDLELHAWKAISPAPMIGGKVEAQCDRHGHRASVDEQVRPNWTRLTRCFREEVPTPICVAGGQYTSEWPVVEDVAISDWKRHWSGCDPRHRRRTRTVRIPRPAITRPHSGHSTPGRMRQRRPQHRRTQPRHPTRSTPARTRHVHTRTRQPSFLNPPRRRLRRRDTLRSILWRDVFGRPARIGRFQAAFATSQRAPHHGTGGAPRRACGPAFSPAARRCGTPRRARSSAAAGRPGCPPACRAIAPCTGAGSACVR